MISCFENLSQLHYFQGIGGFAVRNLPVVSSKQYVAFAKRWISICEAVAFHALVACEAVGVSLRVFDLSDRVLDVRVSEVLRVCVCNVCFILFCRLGVRCVRPGVLCSPMLCFGRASERVRCAAGEVLDGRSLRFVKDSKLLFDFRFGTSALIGKLAVAAVTRKVGGVVGRFRKMPYSFYVALCARYRLGQWASSLVLSSEFKKYLSLRRCSQSFLVAMKFRMLSAEISGPHLTQGETLVWCLLLWVLACGLSFGGSLESRIGVLLWNAGVPVYGGRCCSLL